MRGGWSPQSTSTISSRATTRCGCNASRASNRRCRAEPTCTAAAPRRTVSGPSTPMKSRPVSGGGATPGGTVDSSSSRSASDNPSAVASACTDRIRGRGTRSPSTSRSVRMLTSARSASCSWVSPDCNRCRRISWPRVCDARLRSSTVFMPESPPPFRPVRAAAILPADRPGDQAVTETGCTADVPALNRDGRW